MTISDHPKDPSIVQAIIRLGRAIEKMKSILELDLFDNLSKHNPYWDSEHEPEGEKLDQARRNISFIHEKLYEMNSTLRGYDDDEY